MARPGVKKRSRIGLTLLALLCLGALLLLVLISRLKLDDYRHTLEQHLSAALQQPVTIGSGTMAFRQGLALELGQVTIGSGQPLLVEVPRMTATLLLAPLLRGRLVIEDLELLQPTVELRLPLPEGTATPAQAPAGPLPELAIRMLSVREGELRLHRADRAANDTLHLGNIHAMIYNWRPQYPAELVVSGRHEQTSGEFLLETNLPPLVNISTWRSFDLRTRLQLRHLDPAPLVGTGPLPGLPVVSLELSIDGRPADGARVATRLHRTGNIAPLFIAALNWQSEHDRDVLALEAGILFGFPISGALTLQQQPPKQLKAALKSSNLPLNAAEILGADLAATAGVRQGQLDQLDLDLEYLWPSAPAAAGTMALSGRLAVSDLVWKDPQPWSVDALVAELSLKEDDLAIAADLTTSELGTVRLTGELQQLFSTRQLNLQATAEPQLEQLQRSLDLPDSWKLSGPIPLVLDLRGPLDQPEFRLRADATDSRMQLGRFYEKPVATAAAIDISARLVEAKLQLDQIAIRQETFELTGHGTLQRQADGLAATLSSAPVDLASLGTLHPLLQRLQLHGQATAEVRLAAAQWQGTLTLEEGGARLTPVIGPLNGVSGTAQMDRHGLRFDRLPANLGESAFSVSGELRNWHAPQLLLNVAGTAARAQDLVFFNPEMTLSDLHGNLVIDAAGIHFTPVVVTLEDATRATVYGSVSNFRNPRVELDIEGERVDVLDVIGLFRNRAGKGPLPPARGPREPLVIRITAHQGNLAGMPFTDAHATLVDHNGILTISPLTFASGDGEGRIKVEFHRRQSSAPLKISGHVNNIDASALHQDLLQRPGLVRGRLTGDFYLEGNPAGGQFWQQASGGLYLRISKGTLRRFRGLAQVFSLLNVSQIFSGRLPDMDREGMPFELLEGSIQIGSGLLRSDDLKITSEAMNMSLVGGVDLTDDSLNLILGVMPLRTVDKVVSSIPIAGWLLGGEDRALLTAYFRIEGPSANPVVTAVPVSSLSGTVFGVFRRTLGLPEKLLRDFESMLQPEAPKKVEEQAGNE
ncbi:MAG: AsmA-like C-terminal domain-containing protein [Pelovirga sp.]